MRNAKSLVARCPTCLHVIEHNAEGKLYRCGRCRTAHDLMAELA